MLSRYTLVLIIHNFAALTRITKAGTISRTIRPPLTPNGDTFRPLHSCLKIYLFLHVIKRKETSHCPGNMCVKMTGMTKIRTVIIVTPWTQLRTLQGSPYPILEKYNWLIWSSVFGAPLLLNSFPRCIIFHRSGSEEQEAERLALWRAAGKDKRPARIYQVTRPSVGLPRPPRKSIWGRSA